MKLADVVASLNNIPDGETIYAVEPWTLNSEAITAPEPEAGGIPPEAADLGMIYFLEVFLAKEFLEDWTATQKSPSAIEAQSKRLIEYAINDA